MWCTDTGENTSSATTARFLPTVFGSEDVPAGALGVARGQQRPVEGYIPNRRPGSKWAEAAAESDGSIHPAVAESRQKKA